MALNLDFLRRPPPGLTPGAYQYDGLGELAGHRYHLRVDSESKGVLIVDAAKLIFCNDSALDYVHCLLKGLSEAETLRYMHHRYRKLNQATALNHYHQVKNQLTAFILGHEGIIAGLGPEVTTLDTDELPSPYRMMVALTYQTEPGCQKCQSRAEESEALDLAGWKEVLDKLWGVGVVHLVFCGGEPTLSVHLAELIAHSEKLGQITGMVSHSARLAEPGYLKELVKAGLDHLHTSCFSHLQSLHDRLAGVEGAWQRVVEGLKAAEEEDLHTVVSVPLLSSNLAELEETVLFLDHLGVDTLAFTSPSGGADSLSGEGEIEPEALTALQSRLTSLAEREEMHLEWYLPTASTGFNPVNFGLGLRECTACTLTLALRPDGTAAPCLGLDTSLGNVLKDPWQQIWDHEICRRFRAGDLPASECQPCKAHQGLGGGCPHTAVFEGGS